MAAPDGQRQQGTPAEDAGVTPADAATFEEHADVVVAGAGGTGLAAALAACEHDAIEVLLLEKSDDIGGNTALSTGMIPAAGTRMQAAAGIEETPADMAADILAKNDHEADEAMVQHVCEHSADLIHWLVDEWDVTLQFVDDFKYPKHSEYRMHAPVGRNGENLVAELGERIEAEPNVELRTGTPVTGLVQADGAVVGVETPAGAVGAERVVLGTDGFAGNEAMVRRFCGEEIAEALYYGSPGNTGDGIRLGTAMDADTACMDAYQGHATVAAETELLSTYAIIMNGGIMVNERGERFGDESAGYSEFAVEVVRQPGNVAYELFDERIMEALVGEFEDFDKARDAGSYERAPDVATLAERLGCDPEATRRAVDAYNEAVEAGAPDEVGRVERRNRLEPPFYGAVVTGSLFHTQGGLVIDDNGRVLRGDGTPVPNLYAGGGCAVGISGHGNGGYLSGNGLVTALGFGHLAGTHARRSLA
jgi:fumarate reductase flavoprotein subunit